MNQYTLIARKQVVLDIASGKQTTEERDWTDYYKSRFKNLETPFRLKLRGGYNKIAAEVVVEVTDYKIHTLNNETRIDRLLNKIFGEDQYIEFKLGKVISTKGIKP
jgi:hypothetical protein